MTFWRNVRTVAEEEAMSSPLRGYGNEPADAYRHIIVTAELTRRFGYHVAYGLATGNEWNGTHDPGRNPQAAAGRPMDDHNNAIGLDIGRRARSCEEVVRMAREAIAIGFAEAGSGREGTPMWLPVARQSEGRDRRGRFPVLPSDWNDPISLHGYRYADERFSARHAFRDGTRSEREAAVRERLLATPVTDWSQEDMRAAMRLPASHNGDDPGHGAWQVRLREWFEAQEEACDGVTEVDAHTRQGPSGPVHVAAHRRAVAFAD